MSRFSKAIKKVSRPVTAIATGGLSEVFKTLKPKNITPPYQDPAADAATLDALATEEEAKRQALGLQQQGQINTFADEQSARAAAYRTALAKSLSDNSAETFKRLNPAILEDLNSRGVFTSQTARDQEQGRVLGDLAREDNQRLSDFDTGTYNEINDIRGTGLNAFLGGNQSALDAALGLRKAGITRSFDVQDTNREQASAAQLANRQRRDKLLSSLIQLGGSALSRGAR